MQELNNLLSEIAPQFSSGPNLSYYKLLTLNIIIVISGTILLISVTLMHFIGMLGYYRKFYGSFLP